MKVNRIYIVLSVLTLAALACGGVGVTTEPAGAPPPPPTEAGAQPETSPPVVSGPSSTLDLDNPALYNQPEGITTYLTTMDYRFEAPGPVTGSVRLEGATQVEPYETALEFDTEGRAVMGGGETFYFTQIAGTQYTVYQGFDCLTGTPGAQENPFSTMLDIGGMLTGDAQYIGEEMVNNIPTYAYAITQDNVDTTDPAGIGVESIKEARIHIARDGGYVVRLLINGTGRASVLSGDAALTGDVYYELNYLDFGVPVDIQVPPGCPVSGAVESEYPVTDDAVNLTNVAGVVTFETGLSMEAAVNFYKTEMPALGCGAPQEAATPQLTTLTFSCTSGMVNVVLASNGAGGVSVTIFKV